MAHMTIKEVKSIECKACGSILWGNKIQYTLHGWNYCPMCGSSNLNKSVA